MIVLRQSRYDLLLLGVVVVLSIAANLPDEYAPFDNRVLIATLAVIIGVSLIRYVRISLVLITAVLVLASNLPQEMAVQFGIDKNILLITLFAMVGIAIFNHYLKKIPTGEEPAYRAKSLQGATALFSAVMNGNVKAVQALLKSGVNVNIRTLTGKTPLMAACFKGYSEIAQMLLNSGASAKSRDAEGNTALSIARHQGYSRIVAFLKMAGADDSPQYLDAASLTRLSEN